MVPLKKWILSQRLGREQVLAIAKKSSFLTAPNLTFFVFPKEAVQQVKAKKCISK